MPLPTALTLVKRRASTRAFSRSRPRGVIATVSTFAMSPNRRVSCAAASPRTLITSVSPSPVRSAARLAMSSQCRSVAGIIARCTARATRAHGGGRSAWTHLRLPADSGNRRAEWDSSGLNDRYHLGRMRRPHLLIPRTRKSTPPRRRKKNGASRMFPPSRTSATGYSRITNDQVGT